jgi:hypothetical protein
MFRNNLSCAFHDRGVLVAGGLVEAFEELPGSHLSGARSERALRSCDVNILDVATEMGIL